MTTYLVDAGLTPAVANAGLSISSALAAQTEALVALNLLLTEVFKTNIPANIPHTPANIMRNTTEALLLIDDRLISIKNKLDAMQAVVQGVSGSIDAQACIMSRGVSLQATAVADQIENNAFQQAATKEALIRNDIPVPTVPPLKDTLKQKVINATILQQLGELQSNITLIITATVIDLKNYILSTSAVKYSKEVVNSFFGKIKGLFSGLTDAISLKLADINSKLTKKRISMGVQPPGIND